MDVEAREDFGHEDFGPVPISSLKREVGEVFDALRAGRHVLLSRRSEVVGVIDPVCDLDDGTLAGFVRDSTPSRELTATTINRGSPSAALTAANAGERTPLTHNGRMVGLLRSVDERDLERAIGDADSSERAAARATSGEAEPTDPGSGQEVAVLDGDSLARLLANGVPRPSTGHGRLDRRATDLATTVGRLIDQARRSGMSDTAVRAAVADGLGHALGADVDAWVGTRTATAASDEYDPSEWEIATAFEPAERREA